MEATLTRVAEMPPQPTQESKSKTARKSRRQVEEGVRYFLAKDGSSIEKPELGAGSGKRRRGSHQSVSVKERRDLHRSRLQGGSGDTGRISDIGKAASAQIGRRHK